MVGVAPHSMAGFSRAAGQHDGVAMALEARSLNGKAVEVRTRLPQRFERLEPEVRQHVARRFPRGTIQMALTATRPAGSLLQPTVNEAFLMDLAALAKRLEQQFGAAPARADGLLALRGLLEAPEAVETLDEAALSLLGEALTRLEQSRQTEGAALSAVLAGQVDAIEALTRGIEADPSREANFTGARLSAQVALLMAGRRARRSASASGGRTPGHHGRHPRGDRPAEDACRDCPHAARGRRRGGP